MEGGAICTRLACARESCWRGSERFAVRRASNLDKNLAVDKMDVIHRPILWIFMGQSKEDVWM